MEYYNDKYQRAAERVKEIRKYYGKLFTFGIVGLFFLGINYYSNELRYPWFLWVIGFWGLGLAIEGFKLFGTNLIFGSDWESKMIDREMSKEDSNRF